MIIVLSETLQLLDMSVINCQCRHHDAQCVTVSDHQHCLPGLPISSQMLLPWRCLACRDRKREGAEKATELEGSSRDSPFLSEIGQGQGGGVQTN